MTQQERRNRASTPEVLVVDDEDDIRELLELTLIRMGLKADGAATVTEAKRLLAEREYRLCLTDMRLPDGDGLELVAHINQHCRDLPVAVITAFGSMENAVTALKAGAFDYLAKPVSLDQLRALVKSVFRVPGASASGEGSPTSSLLGDSPAMEQVRSMIKKLARSQAAVHISGESGSGKERAARLIHESGARADQPFVAVNCGAIPENLMESEFFGYRKGAFTGAEGDRDGFFQAANGGTLFLDEVADLPLSMQVKLLRVIQEKRVRRIGDTAELPVDTRIVSATHKNLKAQVDAGLFRQDLFYRLNVIELRMPSLRERREDIEGLAVALLSRIAEGVDDEPPSLSRAALEALSRYAFPGNVRELENILERALALCSENVIRLDDLQLTPPSEVLKADETASPAPAATAGATPAGKAPLQEYLDEVEKAAILEALEKTRYNRTAAAKLLGITFRALRYRMERLGIN